jgi:hypothetical protein
MYLRGFSSWMVVVAGDPVLFPSREMEDGEFQKKKSHS